MDKLEQAISDVLDMLIGYDRQPDGTFACEIYAGHSVGSVYGMCGSAWTRGGVKTIHAPVKLAA